MMAVRLDSTLAPTSELWFCCGAWAQKKDRASSANRNSWQVRLSAFNHGLKQEYPFLVYLMFQSPQICADVLSVLWLYKNIGFVAFCVSVSCHSRVVLP